MYVKWTTFCSKWTLIIQQTQSFNGNEEIGFIKITGAQPFDSFKKVIDAQLETKNNKRLLDLF